MSRDDDARAQALVTVGRVISYTEDERREMFQLATQLAWALENKGAERGDAGPAAVPHHAASDPA